jgi:hypothetical protein
MKEMHGVNQIVDTIDDVLLMMMRNFATGFAELEMFGVVSEFRQCAKVKDICTPQRPSV